MSVQLKAAPPVAPEHIEIDRDQVRVDHWATGDPDVVRHFNEYLERLASDNEASLGDEFERVVKVGVVALKGVATTANVDYVQKEFERQMMKMEGSLDDRHADFERVLIDVFGADDGQLAKELKIYLGQGGQLAALFDPNRQDSAIGRIRQLLEESVGGQGSKLAKLLDPGNADSPLQKWHEEWRGQFNQLRRLIEDYRKEIAEQVAATSAQAVEAEKGTQKGRAYQEVVFDAISSVAQVFGDTVEATWDAGAVNGTKDGDITVTIRDASFATPVKMVFEAKDGEVGLTKIARELGDARDARLGASAVAVYSHADHMPRGTPPFSSVGDSDFLCLYDKEQLDKHALQLAYRVGRWTALLKSHPEAMEIDADGIKTDLEAARKLLKRVTNMKTKLTQISSTVGRAVEAVEDDVEDLRRSLMEIFDRMDSRITCPPGV